MQRRLAAIMVADIVGYSALMEEAEEHTADWVARCRELIWEKVASLGGRIFNTAGDAWLAEFGSAINALRCAAEIRNALAGRDDMEANPLRLRFGLHLADVVVHVDDLIGDGVNVASRIQQEADPDSICISGVFFDHIRRNSPFAFEDLGERRLKNLAEPIRIYRLREELARHRLQTAPTRIPTAVEKRPLSLAVLPFVVGGDENQRFLAEGLTDELIVELARFRRLFVSSRSASFALADADPVNVGSTLGVQYVLEGQVRRISDQDGSASPSFRRRRARSSGATRSPVPLPNSSICSTTRRPGLRRRYSAGWRTPAWSRPAASRRRTCQPSSASCAASSSTVSAVCWRSTPARR
jgi:class 3 adenylate cyclase